MTQNKINFIFALVIFGMAVIMFNMWSNYRDLRKAYDNTPPIAVFDWSEIVNMDEAEFKHYSNEGNKLVKKLKEKGVIVLDTRFIDAAPDSLIINHETLKKIKPWEP